MEQEEKQYTVYLAGAIDGVNWDDAVAWRKDAKGYLEQLGYRVLDPLDGKEPGKHYYPMEIVEDSLNSVEQADALLVEMNTPGAACIGTAIEIRKAWEQKKLIIAWGNANKNSSFLIYHISARVETLVEALLILKNYDFYPF